MPMQVARENTAKRQRCEFCWRWVALIAAFALVTPVVRGEATPQLARVKDVATIEGIRDNQ
jgi:hypothetical protein